MSGLLRRIRRPGAAEENRTEAVALPEPAHGSAPETAPVRADGSPLPAGVSPEDLERRSGTARRGKMRRRVRFLRRARELALRDLGGLVYEAARRDQDAAKLVREKVLHLGVIDRELQALEAELGTPRGETVLREPGVGGTCPRCRELHASDARYCSRCGLDLTAVPVPEPAAVADPTPAEPVADDAAAAPAASEATPGQPDADEASPAEQPRRASKRWWRRRSSVVGEAAAAEPSTSDGADPTPSEAAAKPASPATTGASNEATAAKPAEPARKEAAAAQPAEPATNDAAAAKPAEPAMNDAAATQPAGPTTEQDVAAEPATPDTSAAEQPTTDLAPDGSHTGNGRATKTDAPDRERSA
jgi:hypothetical protein